MEIKPFSKYFAELIGTMVLVLIGCGSAVISGLNIGHLGISFAFGISVLIMVYAIGPVSGCHINPAITISMFALGKIKAKDMIFYIVFQISGAIAGAGILYFIATGSEIYSPAVNGLGQNGFGLHSPSKYSMMSGLIAEVVFTAIFLFVILGSTHKNAPSGFAGIAIGFTLFLIHIVVIPITGTSVNPARSIGPALFIGGDAISQLWMFIVAPIAGGLIGAYTWKFIAGKE